MQQWIRTRVLGTVGLLFSLSLVLGACGDFPDIIGGGDDPGDVTCESEPDVSSESEPGDVSSESESGDVSSESEPDECESEPGDVSSESEPTHPGHDKG
jgi:hypothetical protein